MGKRATPAQDKLAAFVAGEFRKDLTAEQIRALGVPSNVISDAELGAALHRDRIRRDDAYDDPMASYDRRGLLNALAWLAAAAQAAPADLICEEAMDMLAELDERYGEDGPPWVYAAADWARRHICDTHAMRADVAISGVGRTDG